MTEQRQESLAGKYELGRPALRVILLALLVCACGVAFSPWAWLQAVSLSLEMFCAGLLASQHAAIWVARPSGESPPQPKA